ncbi:MAG: hypothetical protein O3A10_06615 [Chloroflexi bacterium]|nr:hypothetical protein [Chloroflexota bacterium]MDA1145004.1 hypothetical protein [Chloroflexota bacterium]
MSETRTPQSAATDDRWVMLAVARDIDTAEDWQAALERASLVAEIRIEDAVITGRSSATNYANGPGIDQLFAYALWVRASERDRSAAVLIESGWDGRYGTNSDDDESSMSARYVITGTIVALAASALFIAALLRASS